ncbi:MAG: urease accessory protein UreD [Pseudomonadota bacterium]|uniref:urease accessory protein UreD n=1 Tax=Guyparkeria sp. TaxID=2035736 RepID=UPI003566AA2E
MIQAPSCQSPATADAHPSPEPRADGWRARLELGFESGSCRTVLRHRRHYGPLRVQRTFHPEGDPCHSYLLHPPGGVVGGDTIEIDVGSAAGAHALITTPAAGKFYRSAGETARQRQHFRVGDGAALEWLPALNILHAGARAALHSRFDIAPGGRLLAWDLLGLGRPGSGDHFEQGSCDLALEVDAGERRLLRERLHLEGGGALLQAPWGLQGRRYLATLIASPGTGEMLDALRDQAAGDRTDPVMGCTLLGGAAIADVQEGGLLACRWLAHSGEALWEAMIRAWFLLRPLVMGRPASAPRIWST